ncbi:MAG: nitroreductase family protein [Clostridia bacterium]|nr:nitroreductase family protein [Clostridia bacterium]
MQQIVINKEKCIGCGKCAKDCVDSAITIEGGKAVVREGCLECGHCFAICPTGAVEMPGYDTSDCGEFVSLSEIDSARFLQGIKSRRTMRQFQKRPVEAAKVKMILEAGRYAPTAKNSQKVAFTVLTSRRKEIEKECVKLFRTGVDVGSKFIKSLERSEIDDNFFFKGAPLVIVVSGYDSVDPSLASAYMELMANSLGLGVLYSGFFRACTILNPLIKARLKLPMGHKVVTCMIIGYPAVAYKRIPPRKPRKARRR